MSNRSIYILAIAAIVLLALAFAAFSNTDEAKYVWNDDGWGKKAYRYNEDEPYDTKIFFRLLSDYFPGKAVTRIEKEVQTELELDAAKPATYVFVGEAMYLDSLSTERLLDFVAAGNTAFIASKTIPFDLMNTVYFDECEDAIWTDYTTEVDTFAYFSLDQPPLTNSTRFFYADRNRPRSYNWHYIEEQFFCAELAQRPLGHTVSNNQVNFAEFPHGKGRFLLHTDPIAFTNFSLLRAETQPYIAGVLSHLPVGDIYWDAVSHVPEAVARRRNNSSSRTISDEHPLTYILKQPALAWMWYILMGLAITWLIFRAKRRQRIIPVLAKNENSSYEFISTIANLHFRERNYTGLCLQGMKLFLVQIRERYGLIASIDPATDLPKLDKDYYRRLAAVSEVPESEIVSIFSQYSNTVTYQPTEQMMVDLHLSIEAFFKKAK